jgi:PAS domain-containing protein
VADEAQVDVDRELGEVAEEMARATVDVAAAVQEVALSATLIRDQSAELEVLHQVLQAVVGATEDVVFVVDGHDARVLAWSQGASRRHGVPADRALGRTLASVRARDLPSGRLAEGVRRLLRPAAADRGDVRQVEVTADGATDGRYVLELVAAAGGAVAVVGRGERASGRHAGAQPADDA